MSYRIRHVNKWSDADPLPPLLSRTERVWLFAERHRGAVLIGILVATLAAVALGVMLWFQRQQGQDAAALAYRASQAYFNRSIDDAGAAQGNLETAARLYRQILEKFPRTADAQLAGYLLGNVLVAQGDYPGAIEAYQRFIKQAAMHPVLRGFVYQRLGAAHLANGERDKGIQVYTRVLNAPGTLNKDQVLFELATLETHAGHTGLALDYFRQLVRDHPNSPFASEAALQVKSLEPPPVTPAETADEETATRETGQEEPARTP